MNGLLDFFKNQDWSSNRVDPGANAQALMGGTPMQYNQQPQGLITPQTQAGTGGMVGPVSPLPGDINVHESMKPYITPQTQPRPDFTNVPLDTWQDPATAGGALTGIDQSRGFGHKNINKEQDRYITPQSPIGPWGSQQQQGFQAPEEEVDLSIDPYNSPTDNSGNGNTPAAPEGVNPGFQWPWEAFGNQQTIEEKIRAQAIARQKLIERGLISPK